MLLYNTMTAMLILETGKAIYTLQQKLMMEILFYHLTMEVVEQLLT